MKPPASPHTTGQNLSWLLRTHENRLATHLELPRHDFAGHIYHQGQTFYQAILEVLWTAEASVSLQAYIVEADEITREILALLEQKARTGVAVRLIVDPIGSLKSLTILQQFKDEYRHLQFIWYHDPTLKFLIRIHHRNHRNLIIIDDKLAFVGGAGLADRWGKETEYGPAWRDSMLQVSGSVVQGLKQTFFTHWGKLTREAPPYPHAPESVAAQAYGAEEFALVLYNDVSNQESRSYKAIRTLFDSASKHIYITNPYFLPSSKLLKALLEASQKGVEVVILVAGEFHDNPPVQWSSRRLYGKLLRAGITAVP